MHGVLAELTGSAVYTLRVSLDFTEEQRSSGGER
jgi:hypothetical protein